VIVAAAQDPGFAAWFSLALVVTLIVVVTVLDGLRGRQSWRDWWNSLR
jgi:hypothetical protein